MRRQWVIWGVALLGISQGLGAQGRATDGRPGGVSEVQRALGGEWTVSGEELRASGARSLAEALAGRVPGLHVLIAPGALGSLGAIQLRAPVSLQAQGAPLVMIDGVPADMAFARSSDPLGPTTWWRVLGDIPLTEVSHVSVTRGLAASVGYGPRAYNGVILVTTRTAAGPGLHGEVRQRVGATARASSVESRRFSLEEAKERGIFFAGPTTPEGRASSWAACGGYCDLQETLFGGIRPEVSTEAFAGWRGPRVQATGALTARRMGTAARGIRDDGLGLATALQYSLGSRGNLRLMHRSSSLSGERPLEGLGEAMVLSPLQTYPSWLSLRGTPALPREGIRRNPVWALEDMRAPRRITSQLTALAAVLPLRSAPRHEVTMTFLGGLHRTAQRDSAAGAWMGSMISAQHADTRERWLRAALSIAGSAKGATFTTTLGAERSGRRASTFRDLVEGSIDLSHAASARAATAAFTLATTLQSRDGRTAAAVGLRRDAWVRDHSGFPAVRNWSAVVTRRVAGSVGPVVRIGVAGGTWSPSLLAPTADDDVVSDTEGRHEIEVGISGTGRRYRWAATVFGARTKAQGTLTYVPPGVPVLDTTRLRSLGLEVTGSFALVNTATRGWTATVQASHARTRHANDHVRWDPGFWGGGRWWGRGRSITAFTTPPSSGDAKVLGDAWPALSYGQINTVRAGRWRLDTHLEGQAGVTLPNAELADADLLGSWTADTLAAARRRASRSAGGTDYLQDASWVRLRQLSLTRAFGRGHGALDESLRLAITVNNVFTLAGWRGLDPTVHSARIPTSVRYDARATYPAMRSISVEILRPF